MRHNAYSNLPLRFRRIVMPIFNRASYARVQSVVERLAKNENFEITVILSSSTLWDEYGKASGYIMSENPRAKFKLIDIGQHEPTHLGMLQACGKIIELMAPYIAEEAFDGMIVVADRYETLPAAMIGAYLNIPLFHIQGGEITGNIDEKVRHAVTKLSDYHFCSTYLAKHYVWMMGESLTRTYEVGCPSLDLGHKKKFMGLNPGAEQYCLCIFHPETQNADEALEQTQAVFEAIRRFAMATSVRCYWYYPNNDPGHAEIIRFLDGALKANATFFIKAANKPPRDFINHLHRCRLIVGNSSCGLREASFFGVPCVNIGSRQNLRERSWNVIDTSYDIDDIFSALCHQHKLRRYASSSLFGAGQAAKCILRKMLGMKEWTIKPSLEYPFRTKKLTELHLGEGRFEYHKKSKRGPAHSRVLRERIQRESEKLGPRDGQVADAAPGDSITDRPGHQDHGS